MAASSLYGAATARLLVTVGYPGKSEVQRGLSGLAGALAYFRGKVNSDSHQAAEKAVSNTKNTLAKLQDVAQAQQIEGANFERAHQQRYIQERLGQFAKASADLNTLTRQSMGKMDAGAIGLSEGMNQALFTGVAEAGDEFQRLEKLASNFYSLGIEGEAALIKELEDTNRARQSAIDLLRQEIKLKESAYARVFEDPAAIAAGQAQYGEKYDTAKTTAAQTLADDKAILQGKIKNLEALKLGTNDLLQ
jgi:hypothetical protein